MREKTSIPQNSIYPLDSIIAPPFSGIVLLLESVHPDNDVVSRAAWAGVERCVKNQRHMAAAAVKAKLRRWGGRLMGSGGCVRSKGGASG